MGRPRVTKDLSIGNKLCNDCRRIKPITEFGIRYPKDWRLSPQRRNVCNSCHSDRQKLRETGVTPKQRADALEEQNGVCKLCNGMYEKPGEKLKTDHCHKTGVSRYDLSRVQPHCQKSHSQILNCSI